MYTNLQKEYGRIYGFYSNSQDSRLQQFLEKNNGKLANPIQSSEFLIIHSIEIDPQFRNQGFGSKLLKKFIEKFPSSEYILVADSKEENSFSLTQWYEKHGFSIIGTSDYGPIMTKLN